MTDRNEARELIAEARSYAADDRYPGALLIHDLADALESALNLQATVAPMEITEDMIDIIQERLYNDLRDGDRPHIRAALESALSAVPVEGDRLSMEVIEEYRRIVIWLEAKAAVLGPAGDTMHGLAAEALGRLIEREYLAHTIPMYAMLDIWQALYGTSHPEFGEFYAEHGYAETWARLCAAARSPLPVEDEVVTDSQVVEAAKVLYDDYASQYEIESWALVRVRLPFLKLARAALNAAHDDWGYADSERQAFIAGVEWQASRPFTEEDVEAGAAAMWDRWGHPGMFKHAPVHRQNSFRADARAALDAVTARHTKGDNR